MVGVLDCPQIFTYFLKNTLSQNSKWAKEHWVNTWYLSCVHLTLVCVTLCLKSKQISGNVAVAAPPFVFRYGVTSIFALSYLPVFAVLRGT